MPDHTIPQNPSSVSCWRDVMLSMQRVTSRISCGVVTITVMVEHGEPAHWEEPTVTRVEPGRLAHTFLERLKGENGSE